MVRPILCSLFVSALCLSVSARAEPRGPLVRDYDLAVSVADRAHKGPSLVSSHAVIGADGARFGVGEGFEVNDVGVSDGYTLEMTFRVDEVEGYRKLVDFHGRSAEPGLYVYSGSLSFYPVTEGGKVAPRREYRLTLERDRRTSEVRVRLDGTPALQFTDTSGDAVFQNGHAAFFLDDHVTEGEQSGGVLRRLQVWNEPGRYREGRFPRIPISPSRPARAVVRDYDFRTTFRDAAGSGPALQPVEGAASTGFAFDAGRGFHLEDTGVTDDYSLELTFSLNELTSYRKLIDFKCRTQDSGLYVYNGRLTFYGASAGPARLLRESEPELPQPIFESVAPTDPRVDRVLPRRLRPYEATLDAAGGPELQPGHPYRVRIERDGRTRVCRVFLDDQLAFQFEDRMGLAVFEYRQAYFFVDDTVTGSEQSGGTVSRIRISGAPGASKEPQAGQPRK